MCLLRGFYKCHLSGNIIHQLASPYNKTEKGYINDGN